MSSSRGYRSRNRRRSHSMYGYYILLLALTTQERNARGDDTGNATKRSKRRLINDDYIPDRKTLEEVLLSDIFGDLVSADGDDKCSVSSSDGRFYSTFTLSPPYFDPSFIPEEENLFLAEMGHTSRNPSSSWRIRIGKGGNIYSYVSSLGEIMPPNRKSGQYMVDEVWQTVSVDSDMNRGPHGTYFIHQAGVYQKDPPYTDAPFFFSPGLASWCSDEKRECRFASWGQHAWTPTPYISKAIYLNRYRDCGNGVLEFTSVVHNAENQMTSDLADYQIETTTPRFNYMSFPWFGVRDTVYRDVLVKKPATATTPDAETEWETSWPNPDFINSIYRSDIKDTGGFVVFAEQREERVDFEFPGLFKETNLRVIPRLLLGVMGSEDVAVERPCEAYGSISIGYQAYHVRCRLLTKRSYTARCPGCELTFTNRRTGRSLKVVNVQHWSLKTVTPNNPNFVHHNHYHIYFAPQIGLTTEWLSIDNYNVTKAEEVVEYVNSILTINNFIDVSWSKGKPDSSNHCLAFVFGTDNEVQGGSTPMQRYWDGYTRLEFGDVYNWKAQFMAVNEVQNVHMDPGTVFGKIQYVITGMGLDNVKNQAKEWVPEVVQDYSDIGDLPGTKITLVMKDDKLAFGYSLGEEEYCLGEDTCVGYSTPQHHEDHIFTIPYFYITCGDEHYFGPDLYHFATLEEDSLIRRSYVCDENDVTIRPQFKLIGFFADNDCPQFKYLKYDADWCEGEGRTSNVPSVSPISSKPTISDAPTIPPTISHAPTISAVPSSGTPTPFYDSNLDQLLLKDIFADILHSGNDKCSPRTSAISGTFSYTLHDPGPFSNEHLLATMSHESSSNPSQSWTLSISPGGNICSFKTALGESVPPNRIKNRFFVEDVWQLQAQSISKPDFLVQQSGPFQWDQQKMFLPYFSPSVSKWCSMRKRECRFASWGSHANIPTKYKSNVLFFSRYRDCGSGVIEFTSAMYNADTHDLVSLLATPSLAVRNTLYRDVLVSQNDSEEWSTTFPPPRNPTPIPLKSTKGYTLFAEQYGTRPPFVFPGLLPPQSPPNFTLLSLSSSGTMQRSCEPIRNHSKGYQVYWMRCRILGDTAVSEGCEGCELTFTSASGKSLLVMGVRHWSYKNENVNSLENGQFHVYLAPRVGLVEYWITEDNYNDTHAENVAGEVNDVLEIDTAFTIEWTQGKSDEDNAVLGIVHGVDKDITLNRVPRYWGAEGQISYTGSFDMVRQSTNFQETLSVGLNEGTTFIKTQFLITNHGVTSTSLQAQDHVPHVKQNYCRAGELPSVPIDLVMKDDGSAFSFTTDAWGHCGEIVCSGASTPRLPEEGPEGGKSVPHFVIRCAGDVYFGPDLYHFAPVEEDGVVRPYRCSNDPDPFLIPFVKLIGFFPEGACSALQSVLFDETHCRRATFVPPTVVSRTSEPTISMNLTPEFSPTDRQPTSFDILLPTQTPTTTTHLPTITPVPTVTFNPTPNFFRTQPPAPTAEPTKTPTPPPTTATPTQTPTHTPTGRPTLKPTRTPTIKPTFKPTHIPTGKPTRRPSVAPNQAHPVKQPSHRYSPDHLSLCHNDRSSWMSHHHGIALRIIGGYNYLTSHIDIRALTDQLADNFIQYGLTWVVITLSSPSKGDRYLAPHSILTKLNPGSTPKYIDGNWDEAAPPPEGNDRDLFLEILTSFSSVGLKVIAYMAAQSPSMFQGERQAYDYDNGASYVDTCQECPQLVAKQAGFCKCAPSVWRWNYHVLREYGSRSNSALKRAYAEIIVKEYVERYRAKVSGYFFDQANDSNMALLYDIIRGVSPNTVLAFNKGQRVPLKNNNYPYEDVTFGYPPNLRRKSAASCDNHGVVTSAEDSDYGYFCVNGKGSLAHVFTSISTDWTYGDIAWSVDQAVEWQARVMRSGGAWTWNVKFAFGNDKGLLHPSDTYFLKNVYQQIAAGNVNKKYVCGGGEETALPTTSVQTAMDQNKNLDRSKPSSTPTKSPSKEQDTFPLNDIDSEATWMSSRHGLSIQILGGFNYHANYYKVRELISQIRKYLIKYNPAWIIITLSSYSYGDRYIAPHSVLTDMNIGSTTKTVGTQWRRAHPKHRLNNDRDLFQELIDGFTTINIKVIAYMAGEGPAMLRNGEEKAFDYDNSSPYVDSCELCPKLLNTSSPFCRCAPSVQQWKQYVLKKYNDDNDATLQRAFAEVIVAEYAKRYKETLAGFFFDQELYMDKKQVYDVVRAHIPHAVMAFNQPQRLPLTQYNYPYEDCTFGMLSDPTNSLPSSCENYSAIKAIEETSFPRGYFSVNGKHSLAHINVPTRSNWNDDQIAWNNEKAAEWFSRVLRANGAWTWNVKLGRGREFSLIDREDLRFLVIVYEGLKVGYVESQDCL